MAKKCFSCTKDLAFSDKPGRGDSCPFCSADLKACRNCRFFDDSSYNECTEPQAERVLEKDRSNYCEYFEFIEDSGTGVTGVGQAEEDPMERLKDLFKDP